MTRNLFLAGLLAATALATACGGGEESPSPTTTAVATSAATPTASRLTPTGTPVATATPTPLPATQTPVPPTETPALLVYTKRVRLTTTEPRWWPTYALEIVTYDLGAKRELASFEVGEVGEYPHQVVIVGEKIAVRFQKRVVLYSINGSDAREVRTAPPGGAIVGLAASPNGAKLALAEQSSPHCDRECRPSAEITSLIFLDTASGEELLVVPQSAPGFAEFFGQASFLTWRDDGSGVVVQGGTGSGQPGGTATVLLDGSVRTHDLNGFEFIAPNGRYAVHGFDLPCMSLSGHDLILHDLDADANLISIHDDSLVFTPGEWSPDSTEFLYSTYQTQPDPSGRLCQHWVKETRTWYVLRVDGSPPSHVTDPEALRDRWYGDRRVKWLCDSRVIDYPSCRDERGLTQPTDMYIGGTKVDSATTIRIIGFIEELDP